MKTVFEFFTKRHLLANALTAMILLIGMYSLFNINREEFPNTDSDRVTVNTRYSGASAEDVEMQVTEKVEDALDDIVGIKTMSSTSRDGSSSIMLTFDEDADADEVYTNIIEKVSGINGLPSDVDAPSVNAMNPAMKSIMQFGVSSRTLTYSELRDYVHQLEKKLLDVPGWRTWA